jgi:orotate phosphoribosyltransferase
MINYRSIQDLNATIRKSLSIVPRDIGLIAGIPRSGLLAANLLALHLNLPLTDIDGLLEGRLIKSGERGLRKNENLKGSLPYGKILVVDDSVLSGSTMREAKRLVKKAKLNNLVIFSAIFVSPEGCSEVDLYFEEIRGYRVFEWNLMHSGIATQSCFDIDGVLCEDPTDEQNDDGRLYEEFLLNAKPLHLPSVKIGYLVTCRLEKYRKQTEEWLNRHQIEYGKLYMMNLPNKEARQASGSHAVFKAKVYKLTGAQLFIESSLGQAGEIARIANSPVLCIEKQQMVYPEMFQYSLKKTPRLPTFLYQRIIKPLRRWIKRRILDIDPSAEQI